MRPSGRSQFVDEMITGRAPGVLLELPAFGLAECRPQPWPVTAPLRPGSEPSLPTTLVDLAEAYQASALAASWFHVYVYVG
jgi:hypothetical protein